MNNKDIFRWKLGLGLIFSSIILALGGVNQDILGGLLIGSGVWCFIEIHNDKENKI